MRYAKVSIHSENHRSLRSPWLRAALLGANDAIVSTASLMVGVAASDASESAILTAGLAGMVAGSLSMAIGEYVSVSSQRDTEQADIEREKLELATSPESELAELAHIYMKRGLNKDLAFEVAKQLTLHNALEAHLRDELGIDPQALAHPFQAAWISAVSFAIFSFLPVCFLLLAPLEHRISVLAVSSLICLGISGALAAFLGNAQIKRAVLRVVIGGSIALLISAGIGKIIGATLPIL